MEGLLSEYLRLRGRGPSSGGLDLVGFERELTDELVPQLLPPVASARDVSVCAVHLSAAAVVAVVDAVPAGARSVALGFVYDAGGEETVCAALARMLRRCAGTLEELELVVEAAGDSEDVMEALTELRAVSRLTLLTQFTVSRAAVLARLPPLRCLWLGTCTLMFEQDAVDSLIAGVESQRATLEELRVTLLPGMPEGQPDYFARMGAALTGFQK
jgi:hypothetical protein